MKLWVGQSYKFFADKTDQHMTYQLQQCGTLDTLLLSVEGELQKDPPESPSKLFVAGYGLCDTIADCWLYLTYEILRTFKDSNKFAQLDEIIQKQFESVFHLAGLVRIPLAKHEAAKTGGRGKKGDFHVPQKFLNLPSGSFGWKVWDKKSDGFREIHRRRLSDAVLSIGSDNCSKIIESIDLNEGNRYAQMIIKAK